MQLRDAIDFFLCAITGARSSSTISWYKRSLDPLVNFLHNPPLESITLNDLRRWRTHLTNQSTLYQNHPSGRPAEPGHLSPWTIHSRLRAVRAFSRWCTDEGLIPANPAARLKLPTLPQQPRKGIPDIDAEKIIQAAANNPRDHALTYFLASTACRVGGAAQLTIDHLDIDTGRALVHEKGGRSRHVYLTPPAITAMRLWMELRPAVTHRYVFTSHRPPHNPLTESGIYQAIKRLAKKAGVAAAWNPHNWRHGAARAMLQHGANLAEVSQMLGHTSITVTADFYGVYADDELQQAHARYSWLNKKASHRH